MKFRRRLPLVGAGAVALLASTALAVVTQQAPAEAHGGLTFPATRTYACYVDGKAGGGGDLNPTNPACAAAVAQGGKQPLWDWFANLISNNAGQHRQNIPDGQLCGPTPKYAAFNMARTDWPTTALQSGATITIRYNAWAPHPGTWYQYITKDGWNPNQPLRWSDLEDTPFDQVTNPPINGSGPDGAEYTWSARLPVKQGRHIIYSVWQRSDSPEAFFNCSDVTFGGTPPTGGPPTSGPPTSGPPTSGPPTSGPPTSGPPTGGPSPCSATVTVGQSWPGGFQGTVTVRNTGTSSIGTWLVGFTVPTGTTVAQGWNGTYSQTGTTIWVRSVAWNGTIPPGGSTTSGFNGSGPSSPAPTGVTCS